MLRLSGILSGRNRNCFLFLVGGLFFGIFYAIFLAGDYLQNVGFVSDYFQVRYLQEEMDTDAFLPYLVKGRGFSFFLLWIMGSSFLGSILIYAVLCWIGFSVGIYLAAATMKFGIAGVGFSLAAVFPQVIFYIPSYGLVLWQAYAINRKRAGMAVFNRNDYFANRGNRELVFRYCVVLVAGILLLFLGILTESYINPVILKKLLEKF